MRFVPILLTFLLAVISNDSIARKGSIEGYIIVQSGDTVHGLIKDRVVGSFPELYDKIRFKENGKRKIKKYGPKDILGYGYRGVDFRSVRLRSKMERLRTRYYTDIEAPFVFLRVVSSTDELSYYVQEFVDGETLVIESFPLFHLPESSQMVRVTQGVLGLKKKRLSEYFSFCPKLIEAVNNDLVSTSEELFNLYHEQCTD